jgi:hypothetical protein
MLLRSVIDEENENGFLKVVLAEQALPGIFVTKYLNIVNFLGKDTLLCCEVLLK